MKATKLMLLVLSLVFASLLGACATNEEASAKPAEAPKAQEASKVVVWSAPNTKVVMQDEPKGDGEAEVSFYTFKGDVESAQLLFTATADVDSFNFEMGDVTNENGDVLSSDLFEMYVQRYIWVRRPTSNGCLAGNYPDALVPLRNYCIKKENKVSKDCNQGLWFNLNVPADAKAGTYTGTWFLTVEEETIDIPVSVTVYDIDMPQEIHTVSSFYFQPSHISTEEGKDLDMELQKLYYDFMVKKRANVRDIPGYFSINMRHNPEQYANDVVEYARNPMVSCYALPYRGDSNSIVEYEYCYNMLYALAAKNVELLDKGEYIDLFKKAHYYLGALIDEPTPEKADSVRACDYNIHKAKLAVAATGILNSYPEVKASLLSLRHVVTTKIDETLIGTDSKGGVQTWVPLINHFATESQRQLSRERQNSTDRTGGEEVWWYSCINPKNPFPSYQTDEDMLLARIRGWMQYDYKVHGNLYWCVNYWLRYDNKQAQSTNIWTEPLSWEGANGDGRLIYPGRKYGVKGPIATFRLENLRESNEDYELLWLFEQTVHEINAVHGKEYDSDRILNSFYNRLYSDLFRNEDLTDTGFEAIRIELMQLLETMLHDTPSALPQLDRLMTA